MVSLRYVSQLDFSTLIHLQLFLYTAAIWYSLKMDMLELQCLYQHKLYSLHETKSPELELYYAM